MDTRVLAATLALSAVSTLLCGLAPALQSTRVDLVNGLKSADVDMPGRKRLWAEICWWSRRFPCPSCS